MPIVRLPLLRTDSHCQRLTVCGRIAVDDEPLKKWLRDLPPLESQYVKDGHCNYVAAMLGETHLHLDLAVCGYFGGSPPQAQNAITDINAALDKLIGREAAARIEGVYQLPVSKVPDFILAALQVESKVGNVSLVTNGGRFAIRGAPAISMEWWLQSGSDHLCITLAAQRHVKIEESYLEDCFDDLERTFNALFLGT